MFPVGYVICMHSRSLKLDVMIMLVIVRITDFGDRVYPFGYFGLQATQNNLMQGILGGSETTQPRLGFQLTVF